MRNPTAYLKMRVLGAIDMAEGKTIRDRIKAVSQLTFTMRKAYPGSSPGKPSPPGSAATKSTG